MRKKVDILQEFERQVGQMMQTGLSNSDNGHRPLTDEELRNIHSTFSLRGSDELDHENEWMVRVFV